MRRWKKIAALLLAACLLGNLCACGGGGEEPAGPPEPAPAVDVPQPGNEPEPAPVPEPEPVVDETPPEPEPEPVPEPEPEGPAEPEGLILLSLNPDMPKDQCCCMVSSLDPETGEVRVLSSFDYRGTMEYYFDFPENRYATGKDRFNDDYTKIALTWGKRAGKERHAGWMNSDGSFFDVTEALGQNSSSEFADPVYYYAFPSGALL